MDSVEIRARQRIAQGARPYFLSSADLDRLLAMIMALTGEVAVLRERIDTHERLADQGRPPASGDVEAFAPSSAVEHARAAGNAQMLERVFRILDDAMQWQSAGEASPSSAAEQTRSAT